MTKFRVSQNDTIRAYLYDSSGKLLTSIYDSGYTRIDQIKNALLSKCCNPPKEVKFFIINSGKCTYWTNR